MELFELYLVYCKTACKMVEKYQSIHMLKSHRFRRTIVSISETIIAVLNFYFTGLLLMRTPDEALVVFALEVWKKKMYRKNARIEQNN